VLAVDDNASNRRILEGLLTGWGMQPVLAENGEAALRAISKAHETGRPFGLTLVDLEMPGMDGLALAAEIGRRAAQVGTKIVMLGPSNRKIDDAQGRDPAGIHGCLVKPVRPSELLKVMLSALDGSSPAPTVGIPGAGSAQVPTAVKSAIQAAVPSASLHSAPAVQPAVAVHGRALSILLTEDNLVNQRVATRLLEKRGHTVMVANNGREAVNALERERFDLVLMDVQMPVMNGFEATATIRKTEQATGDHIPIIAMTAHAMKGDRELCLNAGMDGYITKPIQSIELFQLITELVPDANSRAI
jgi:CheY-like chemotaxis protein